MTNTNEVYCGKWDWGTNTPEPATSLTGLSGIESFEVVDNQRDMAMTNIGQVYSGVLNLNTVLGLFFTLFLFPKMVGKRAMR